MKVILANDHGAVVLASGIKEHLESSGITVDWIGTKTTDSVDYPDMASAACRKFLDSKEYDFGILCCGTGIGISISANKINGIRCALPQNVYAAKMAHEHNNANFIAFGGRIDYQCEVNDMIDAFIDTAPSKEERHIKRVAKMMALEKQNG